MKKLLASLAIGAILISPAWADSTIDALTAGAAVSATDVLPAVQGSDPAVKVTGAQLKTFINTSAVDARTTTSEAIANSDQNKLVTFTNAGAVACTIAQAGTGGNFLAGWAVALKNSGAGTVTCTPTTSTIDGAATLVLTTGQGVDLYSDGTNYFTQGGKASGSGTVTTSGSPASGNLSKFSGSSSITNGDLSGNCTTNGTLATTCGAPQPTYQVNSWYTPGPIRITQGGQVSTVNTINCVWGFVPKPVTINAIGAHVMTVGTTNLQYALYSVGTNGLPAALISNTGSVTNSTLGARTASLGSNVAVGPGSANTDQVFWCYNSGDSTVILSAISIQDTAHSFAVGSPTSDGIWAATNTSQMRFGLECAAANCNGGSSTFGTWPPSLAGSTWTNSSGGTTGANQPQFQFQITSIP